MSTMTDVIKWARELAQHHLAYPLPRRWSHVQGVAAKAETLRDILGADADLVVAAAWLHDIGYAPDLHDTGFHPVDGARYLTHLGADPRLCGLVAHHSGARFEAALRGLSEPLSAFVDETTIARDAVWYADMTTSPVGAPTTFDDRLSEIIDRYGPGHLVPQAITAAAGQIRAAIARVTTLVAR
jgi:putative nucleotidyltransferase with HDIG domain